MYSQRIKAASDQRGGQYDGQEDIGRRHRHTNTQNKTGGGPHQQQDAKGASRQKQQLIHQGARQSRHGEGTNNQANPAENHQQLNQQHTTGLQKF